MSVSVIVPMSISTGGSALSRPGFGTPMFACYHNNYVDRIRAYSSPDALLDDGFTVNDTAYKMATKAWSQDPHPPTFKVGRRALAHTQTLHFTPVNVTEGFEYTISVVDLEGATIQANYEVQNADTVEDICDELFAKLDPVAASVVSANSSTFVLTDGMTLTALVDGEIKTALFETADFANISLATAAEVVAVVNADFGDTYASGTTTVTISSLTIGGPRSTVRITGGTANAILGFPTTLSTGAGVEGLDVTDSTTHLVCAAAVAGGMFDYDVGFMDPVDDLMLEDLTADPGIATDLAAITAVDSDWYGMALDSNSGAEVTAATAWLQTREKIGAFHLIDSEIVQVSVEDDALSNLQAASYTHAHIFYSQRRVLSYSGAAILGEMLPTDPGTSTWAFNTLEGVLVDPIKDSHAAVVLSKGGNYYSELAGVGDTQEGLSPGGEYLDTVRFLHYLQANMQLDVIAALKANPKIAFTNLGLAIIGGVLEARLVSNVETPNTARGLSSNPAPQVLLPRAEDALLADKQIRYARGIEFSAQLAGAIHKVGITGKVAA